MTATNLIPLAEAERREYAETGGRGRTAGIVAVDDPLRVVTVAELLALDIPPREMLLSPIIPSQGLAMLYSPRGIGKTHVALGIAYAVASGGTFLRWRAPKPRRVLLIDGEMPGATLQARLASIAAGAEIEPPDPSFLRILAADLQGFGGVPNLATAEGVAALDPLLHGDEFIIVDNISTTCRHGRENESESWEPVQDWALRQRRAGRSVLFVHHAGKGGAQRGTSRREDVLDTVISLRRPDDYNPIEGARFEVHVEKGRGIVGADAEPFEARLEIHDGAAVWSTRNLEDVTLRRVADLHTEGFSVRDIATELNISKSRADRLIRKAKEAGLIHD